MAKWLNKYLPETAIPCADSVDGVPRVSRLSASGLGILGDANCIRWRELFEERSAIHEFEDVMPRIEAECRAREALFWDFAGMYYPVVRAEFEGITNQFLTNHNAPS